MDGFTGFKTATTAELPQAVQCGFQVARTCPAMPRSAATSKNTHGHRGRKGDPLYNARRTLHTGADLLTDKQTNRLTALFALDEHVHIEATWGIYQRMIAAYREPDNSTGRELMTTLIDDGQPRRARRVDRDHHASAAL